MKQSAIFVLFALLFASALALTSSCVPRRRPPLVPGVVVPPGHRHGPPRGPNPRVVYPPKPHVVKPKKPHPHAVWVAPVWHWNGTRWTVKKKGYWRKSTPGDRKNRGKGKGKK